jgi:hypothetical protein
MQNSERRVFFPAGRLTGGEKRPIKHRMDSIVLTTIEDALRHG